MRLALAVGRRNLGTTGTNPSVGAVVVEPGSGRVLGVGATAPGGRPHAEPLALAGAGAAARGATLYVTLEPCSHHGRTPPCADAIVEAGIARVVSAMADPNPLVAGRGHQRLRAAGVAVATGMGGDEARRDHAGHVARVTLGRPHLHLKLARTADGYAGRPGERLHVTGEAANARTHLLRARADAVLVGIGTVLADDPRLNVRLPGLEERSPARVVLDGRLRTPPDARLLARGPALILCGPEADPGAARRLRERGAEVLSVPTGPDGRLDLGAALRLLGERGLLRVFCEGGPALAEALAEADLVDEATILTGESRLDGPGIPAIRPGLARRLATSLRRFASADLGPDRLERYERISCSPGS